MGRRKTHQEYLEELEAKGILHIPLETYKGRDKAIDHKCPNSHITKRLPVAVLRGSECSICVGNYSCDHSGYLTKLKNKNIQYVPQETYKGSQIKLSHKCPKCANIWKVTPANVLMGQGCPKCNTGKGLYSPGFFKNNPETGNNPGILYVVVLVNKTTLKRECVKIGITQGTSNKDVLKRATGFSGYDTRVQKIVKGTLEEIYYLESYLHELWSEHKYTESHKFGGYTELFDINKLQDILKSVPDNP